MKISSITAMLVAAMATVGASAGPVTFDFTGQTFGGTTSKTYSLGGLSLTVEACMYNLSNGTVTGLTALTGSNAVSGTSGTSGGLGVGSNSVVDEPGHEALKFTFSSVTSPITLNFSMFDGGDFLGYAFGSMGSPSIHYGSNTLTIQPMSGATELYLGAGAGDFRVASLSINAPSSIVAPVPLPMAGMGGMLLAGAMGVSRRRRMA